MRMTAGTALKNAYFCGGDENNDLNRLSLEGGGGG
jgi:hypothetical protein